MIENSNSRRYLAGFLKNPEDFVILPPLKYTSFIYLWGYTFEEYLKYTFSVQINLANLLCM